jgi:hypothetical protein
MTRTAHTDAESELLGKNLLERCRISAALIASSHGVCLDPRKVDEKVTSDTVAYCSTFRLFVVDIVLP